MPAARPAEAPASDEAAATRRAILLAIGLALATVAVFWPATGCDFINFDDPDYVTENPAVLRGLGVDGLRFAFNVGHTGNWIPLTWLSHMLDVSLFGVDPAYHHLHSIVLHALNAALLLFVLLGFARHAPGSADRPGVLLACGLAAGIFALHPLRLESAVWISERKDLLAGAFWLATLLAWLRYARRPSGSAYAAVAVLMALGLMAKPMLVSLPLILLVLDAWPLGRLFEASGRPRVQVLLEKVPLAALAGASALLTLVAQTRSGAVTGVAVVSTPLRLANAVVAYAGYLWDLVWPTRLAVFYPFRLDGWPAWQVVLSASVLAAITVLALKALARYPWIAAGWAWYLISAAPVIGLVKVGQQASADRYTYLPLIGPTVVLVWGGAVLLRRLGAMRWVLGAGILVVLIVSTRAQIGYWQDSITLFQRATEVTRDNHMAHYSLSLEYAKRGDLERALIHGHEAVWVYPQFYDAYLHVAELHLRRGEYAKARFFLGLAMRQDPDAPLAWLGLGRVLLEERRTGEAVSAFEKAVQRAPRAAAAHYNLGVANEQLGQTQAALDAYRTAVRLAPEHQEAWLGLGRLAVLEGLDAEAEEALRRAVELRPDDARAQRRLAILYLDRGDLEQAEAVRQRLEPLDPAGARRIGQLLDEASRRRR